LTSIHGVDPIIVNNIKVLTQKSVVIETKKAKVNDNQKDKKDEEKEKRHREPSLQNLMTAVEKLNKLLEINKIPLCFQIINNQGVIKVQLIDTENKNIISEMVPEKAFELLMKFNTIGFTINELI
jgi:uncharacterized FlaG/YvyC family protein